MTESRPVRSDRAATVWHRRVRGPHSFVKLRKTPDRRKGGAATVSPESLTIKGANDSSACCSPRCVGRPGGPKLEIQVHGSVLVAPPAGALASLANMVKGVTRL